MGLFGTFLLAFAVALVYQRRQRRDWGAALHLATVFGLAMMLLVFIGALIADGAGLLPTYAPPAG